MTGVWEIDLPLNLGQFLVAAWCAYRLTQFFVYDSLIGFNPESGSKMSDRIDAFAYWPQLGSDRRKEGDGPPGMDRTFLRGKIGDLLTCPWCLGFWLSLGVYLGVALGTDSWSGYALVLHAVGIFAVAGVQGFLVNRAAVDLEA